MQNTRSNLNHKYIYTTYLIALRIIPFYQNLCFQQLHCHLHVLVLISFCLALSITQLFDTHLCNNSSRDVCETNRAFCLIYMLISRTWWSESINLQFRRKNRNRFGPLHNRRHRNRGKRGMTTTVFIKGRNAHETMNSTFLRKIGRHIVIIDTEDTTMTSRSFMLLWKTVTTPTHVLGKIPIHFEEHASPIIRIFTSRTRMKF